MHTLLVIVGWLSVAVMSASSPTVDRRVEGLVREGWRRWHVWMVGAGFGTVGGLVAAHSGSDGDAVDAMASVMVPVLLGSWLTGRRVNRVCLYGPAGSYEAETVDRVAPDVEPSAAATWTEADYQQAAEVFPATYRPGLVSRFTVRTGARDVTHRRRRLLAIVWSLFKQSARVSMAMFCIWLVVSGGSQAFAALTGKHLTVTGQVTTAFMIGWLFALTIFAFMLLVVLTLPSVLNMVDRVRAYRIHRGWLTWPNVASAHGWRITRPAGIPFPHWVHLPLFEAFHPKARRRVRPPAVALSGRVGQWDTWVVAGQGPQPVVAAVVVPGANFPVLMMRRIPNADNDTFQHWTTHEQFAEDVLTDEVMEFLAEAMPAFAVGYVHGDVIGFATSPIVDANPWYTDPLVACAVGLADRVLDAVVRACLPTAVVDAVNADDRAPVTEDATLSSVGDDPNAQEHEVPADDPRESR